ncbi:hypothetical protein E0H75_29035 [Kribbella capetownensis]|uniref:Uncharacterized protein n=1 Tax=Kribbella capetownensis TaxID=1572659 RepID=A0A4R0JHS0_9ACTN|nr:hypothetical protein [Kribbella capetownensis]TCC45767.1 hypothetical protein E0H75_29035 [Kribbella capetownensis]
MTAVLPTSELDRGAPRWMTWVPWLAVVWAAGYGCVRLWFALGHEPTWKLPTADLLVPGWVSVIACVVSALLVLTPARTRALMVLTYAIAVGWTAACALALLDVVAGVLPGLGIPFDLAGMLSRLGGLTGAVLLAGTALSRQRQLDGSCLGCSNRRRTATSTPKWAIAAAWIAIAGCATRLAAQAAIGFDAVSYAPGLQMILFEAGFLLAGLALPLLLVYRPGRVFPRWMLLLPGIGLGTGISAYFGVGLIQMTAAALQGKPVYAEIGLPTSFFWVAVPAYLLWGLGLAVATYGYAQRTRKPCKLCGR